MASALMILFLGCWLAGQSGVSGEGTNSAKTPQPDPTTTETEGTDAGSSPAEETDPTQLETTLAPTHPRSTEPDTGAGGGKSPSTTPKTGGTDPTHSGTTPTSPCPSRVGSSNESGDSESPSTPTKTEGTDPAGPQQPESPQIDSDRKGGTDPTHSGTTPTSPCPSRVGSSNESEDSESPSTPTKTGGSEPSAAPGLTRNIIAGVSAAATGLLLLLLAFLCYRRKRPAPRQTRECEPATTVYALMGEGKQLDVLPQKPDPGAEGLTYAELDGQALQAKQGGAAPAPEPVLYATITMSQGPNGQSPQGAAEPPTDPHSVNPGGVTGETGQEASATTG